MMNKNNSRILLLVVLAVVVGLCLCGRSSGYDVNNSGSPLKGDNSGDSQYADANLSNTGIDLNLSCAMGQGTGLASSLLPREVASQEDFGQFAPDEILGGQNFLDPRQQIGWPETIGGVLRNGNQQIRADPPNPKQPYTWNNSTIPSDQMRRDLC